MWINFSLAISILVAVLYMTFLEANPYVSLVIVLVGGIWFWASLSPGAALGFALTSGDWMRKIRGRGGIHDFRIPARLRSLFAHSVFLLLMLAAVYLNESENTEYWRNSLIFAVNLEVGFLASCLLAK